jgi:hypothetical protein
MKAVLLGLKSLCNKVTGKHVRVQSDNVTTVAYINEFCSKQKTDLHNPPVNNLLDFLANLHEKGLKYTTSNVARRAVSTIVIPSTYGTIANHLIVSRFMKGIYESSPPNPRYRSTWDVQPGLTYNQSAR